MPSCYCFGQYDDDCLSQFEEFCDRRLQKEEDLRSQDYWRLQECYTQSRKSYMNRRRRCNNKKFTLKRIASQNLKEQRRSGDEELPERKSNEKLRVMQMREPEPIPITNLDETDPTNPYMRLAKLAIHTVRSIKNIFRGFSIPAIEYVYSHGGMFKLTKFGEIYLFCAYRICDRTNPDYGYSFLGNVSSDYRLVDAAKHQYDDTNQYEHWYALQIIIGPEGMHRMSPSFNFDKIFVEVVTYLRGKISPSRMMQFINAMSDSIARECKRFKELNDDLRKQLPKGTSRDLQPSFNFSCYAP